MSDHTGIAVVWPAYFEGSTDSEAHVTALFLGNTDTAEFTREQALAAIQPVTKYGSWGDFTTKGTALFGKDNNVPVILLQDGGLGIAVKELTKRLNAAGIMPSTMFPFNPHVTVPERSVIPMSVHLSTPTLWWGNERTIHPVHAKREGAVDAAVAAVRAEHGDWFAGIIECEQYRPMLATAVNAVLKAVA
jgi:hypothetical protein